MSQHTSEVNAVVANVKAAIGSMDAAQLMSLLIALPEVIGQRAYDIQCESPDSFERADASYAKMMAREASDLAERDVRELASRPGR